MKKILIGSIIAIAVLIGVSFTSVVGYNSVTSDVKASPLFAVRSSRAIDKASQGLSCDYIGKGNAFLIPKRDSKTVLIQKFVYKISNMDDITFKRFLNLITNLILKNNQYKDERVSEILTVINQIRNNPDRIISDYSGNSPYTWGQPVFLPTYCYFPGCYILTFILLLIYILLDIPITLCDADCLTLKI